MSVLVPFYLWIKALHVIAIIAWMAGLLYLPRLFVYHAGTPSGSAQSATFIVMERRLYWAITVPAMLAALVLGHLLLRTPGVIDWHQGWIHVKLVLVLVLLAYTYLLGVWARAFATDRNRHSARFFRIMNEVPTLIMIMIVILVIVKPF